MLLGRDRRREGIAGIRIKDHRGAQEVTPDIFFSFGLCVFVCVTRASTAAASATATGPRTATGKRNWTVGSAESARNETYRYSHLPRAKKKLQE